MHTKGTLFARRGKTPDWSAGEPFYSESLAVMPQNAAAAYLLGLVYFSRGSYDVAGKMFARSLEADCDFASAYSYLVKLPFRGAFDR